MNTLGIFHSTIRGEEKLIIKEAKKRNVKTIVIDIRNQLFHPQHFHPDFDIALERSVSTVKGNYSTDFLEAIGITVVNSSMVAHICGDKFLTSLTLQKVNIPTPEFCMMFSLEQAKVAIEQMGGYPIVLKPVVGSWGRLLAKVNDEDALEAIIEHKEVLGSPYQKAFYIQKYIQKPEQDIRAFVINHEAICAIYRESSHWITNTARGGRALNCPVTRDLSSICKRASKSVGGGILAIDLFETDAGLLINEINHTMEFKNSEEPTGISISGAIVDYCISLNE